MLVLWRRAFQSREIDYNSYTPDNANFTMSDHGGIAERTAQRLRFLRPITDGNGFQHACPAARVSFVTDATNIRLELFWNALVTRLDTFNSVGSILVNDVEIATFNSAFVADVTGLSRPTFSLSSGTKTVSIIWPYGAGLDLQKIELNSGATLSPSTRPIDKIVCCGDSITHGYSATKTTKSWPYLLAALKDKQIINLGYGGAQAVSDHANGLQSIVSASTVLYMIGFNNFYPNTDPAVFQSRVEGWITGARAAQPTAKIYIISPIYSTKSAADYGHITELQTYREHVQAAEIAAGDTNTYFIDGLTLMTNSAAGLQEGIHPNDAGSLELAQNFNTAITAIGA